MEYQERQELMAQKLKPILTANLKIVLATLDDQIQAERAVAQATGNFDQMQSLNFVRTVALDVLDERGESEFVDAYLNNKLKADA
jgi:hypothetical protein